MSASALLEYAPGAPVRRRKRIRRLVILLMLLVIGFSGWRWGPAIKQHAELLYWQRQCMNFQFPRDVVLWEKDPTQAAGLLRQQNPDHVPMGFYVHIQPMQTHALYHPRSLREFETRSSTSPAPAHQAVVFLHERRTPVGKRRLVVIFTSPWDEISPEWTWAVYEPAVISKPKLLNSGQSPPDPRKMMSGLYAPKRFGPGQTDPADPSRFTLPLVSSGRPIGVYDGRLTDNDTIEITGPRKR